MSIKKQTDGTYSARVSFTDNLGKRREKNKKGIKSSTAAKKWERDILNKIDAGEFDEFSTDMTLNSAFDMWLKTYSTKVAPSTYRKTEQFINLHILTHEWFDQVKVDHITSVMLQRYINELSTLIFTYKQNLSSFKHVMKMLVSLEVIKDNPFDKVTFPKPVQPKVYTDRVDYYTKDQLKLFLDTAKNIYADSKYYVYAFFRILAFSGLRKGEALALEWSDIDFTNNTININKALSLDKLGNTILSTPKTKAGIRTIRVDKTTISVLKHYQAIQSTLILKQGLKSTGFIFTDSTMTKHLKARQPRKWCEVIVKDAGLPRIKIHGFRHTYATLSIQAGMNVKQLQYQLGHDDIQTTLGVYASITEDMKETTADIFTSLVNF